RHEALRTSLVGEGDEPVQVIAPDVAVDLPLVDLSSLPPEKRQAEADRATAEATRQHFDLTRAPLWRAQLIRLAPQDHRLVGALHHALTDDWSNGVLIRDLSALYEAAVSGQPADLPLLRVQYADFSRGENERLQTELPRQQLAYWKQRLAGTLPTLQLPI